jgi:hypothetical protein
MCEQNLRRRFIREHLKNVSFARKSEETGGVIRHVSSGRSSFDFGKTYTTIDVKTVACLSPPRQRSSSLMRVACLRRARAHKAGGMT